MEQEVGKVVQMAGGKQSGHTAPPAKKSGSRYKSSQTVPVQKEGYGQDYTLIFVVLFLLAFGLVMLYSTSSYEANLDYGDSAYYLKRQAIFTLIGLFLMFIVEHLPIEWFRKGYGAIYLFSVVMMFLIIPFGTTVNGATRWIYIGGISVQPAEICKLAVILLTAAWLSQITKKQLRTWKGFVIILAPAVFEAGLIYFISDNLSSALIVIMIAVCMLFVTSEDYWRYFLLAAIVIGAAVIFVLYSINAAEGGFRSQRILAWLNPSDYADSTALQTIQGLYGIGSGGIFGKGLGQSMQKLGFVPEAQNDMIFTIICEELGLFGAFSIIMMFLLLAWRMMMVATHANTLFESLVVIGVMSHIVVQVILNIAVVTNTIPNTGVTLPFFSYGGSAVVMLLVEIGLVLGIARNSGRKQQQS